MYYLSRQEGTQVLADVESIIDKIVNSCTKVSFREKLTQTDIGENYTENYFIKILQQMNADGIFLTTIDKPCCAYDGQIYLNEDYYKKNKEALIKTYIEKAFNNNFFISIDKIFFSDEVVDKICQTKGKNFQLIDISLSKEQEEKLLKSFNDISIIVNNKVKKIENKHIIDRYTMNDIEKAKSISFLDFNKKNIENLKYVGEDVDILISLTDIDDKSLENITLLQQRLEELNKKNKIIIKDSFKNLEPNDKLSQLLKKSSNIVIHTKELSQSSKEEIFSSSEVDVDYTSTYIKVNDKLNELVKDMPDNLSTLERYIYVYNITKTFKRYKENPENKFDSRSIDKILFNEYIVCSGFTELLSHLCKKVGIETSKISLNVDLRNRSLKNNEETPFLKEAHSRLLVNIDDDVYNVHNYFIADPTWDNNMIKETYDYMLKPIDSMDYSSNYFWEAKEDAYLNVHSEEEYQTKLNRYLKIKFNEVKKLNKNTKNSSGTLEQETMQMTLSNIFNTLKKLDNNLYNLLNDEYENIKSNSEISTRDKYFKYEELMINIGKVMIKKNNKKLPIEILTQAVSNVKDIENKEKFKTDFINREQELFPYENSEYRQK